MNIEIAEFEVNTEFTTDTGKHAYVVSEDNGKYFVGYEIDGISDENDPVEFDNEAEAIAYAKKEAGV